jgi:hypothetical protein
MATSEGLDTIHLARVEIGGSPLVLMLCGRYLETQWRMCASPEGAARKMECGDGGEWRFVDTM